MKGILLAGGNGTRLAPSTNGVNKHLLPIYDKPMIYYPLSVLMLGGIQDIMIISTPESIPHFRNLLGDGSAFGIRLQYKEQHEPRGIPEAFILAENFIGDDDVALILGDNLFYGQGFTSILRDAIKRHEHATIFGYRVKDPGRFGVVDFDDDQKVISLEEKPDHPQSDFAVTGLYIYDHHAVQMAKWLPYSNRDETEITDLNRAYLKNNQLDVQLLGRGFAWMDAGTHESLFDAAEFVKITQQRQGFKIACLEEISYYMGYISQEFLYSAGESMKKTDYGQYLMEIAGRQHTKQYWEPFDNNPLMEQIKHE